MQLENGAEEAETISRVTAQMMGVASFEREILPSIVDG